jgi:hypothetical protein
MSRYHLFCLLVLVWSYILGMIEIHGAPQPVPADEPRGNF